MASVAATSTVADENGIQHQSRNAQYSNGEKNGAVNSKSPSSGRTAPSSKVKSSKEKSSLIGTLMKLRRASKRPLPKETGDGSYRTIVNRPSIIQDLKTIGFKGIFITKAYQ